MEKENKYFEFLWRKKVYKVYASNLSEAISLFLKKNKAQRFYLIAEGLEIFL